jgi:hypothetical protein
MMDKTQCAECERLARKVEELESELTQAAHIIAYQTHADVLDLIGERDQLAAQNLAMREALQEMRDDYPVRSELCMDIFRRAGAALALPDLATDILRKRDAETRKAAILEASKAIAGGSFLHDKAPAKMFANEVCAMLGRLAELEKS